MVSMELFLVFVYSEKEGGLPKVGVTGSGIQR